MLQNYWVLLILEGPPDFRAADAALAAISEFTLANRVRKVTGDYTFEGRVVGVISKSSGRVLYAVEDDRGIVRIFLESQLERIP